MQSIDTFTAVFFILLSAMGILAILLTMHFVLMRLDLMDIFDYGSLLPGLIIQLAVDDRWFIDSDGLDYLQVPVCLLRHGFINDAGKERVNK